MKQKIASFLTEATTAYQTICAAEKRLTQAGYERLYEEKGWEIRHGGRYYVVRGDSSLLAFQIPQTGGEKKDTKGAGLPAGFHIICAHSDSPCFKIKENPEMQVGKNYLKLNVEKYGGMIAESWLDRPLSVAGRIVIRDKTGGAIKPVSIPVDLKKPVLIIPSLAIHMKRGSQEDKLNPQLHLLPMAGVASEGEWPDFMQLVADAANRDGGAWQDVHIKKEDILGTDLFLYVYDRPVFMGFREELLGAPRLDDLLCVYCGLEALLSAEPKEYVNVLAIFDNEEVGSRTMQGADSDFLQSVLTRIAAGLAHGQMQAYERMCAGSFMLSADNAHALHPNYMDKADPTNQPVLNGGIVIKYHGGQKYTTSGYSGAYVKMLCEEAQIPYQTYHNRSDVAGGSTLGNLAASHVSIPAADVGIAQMSMHSAFETAAAEDIRDMCLLMGTLFKL